MDLSFVQEQLDTFATFAGAIGDFLKLPAQILGSVVDWFNGEEVHPWIVDAETGEGVSNGDAGADWDTTKDALGSSNDSEGEAGFSFGSSEDSE
ncbi:PorH family porin [Corynebacterium casei]|uniref:PorH family porin n=1 Tax=Corynebacterium casei TaxID=160386 RepID=UPI003FD2BC53